MGKGWKQAGKQEKAAAKGKIFTKVAREISVAAKLGGPDPEGNSRLKLAILAAKEVSCPKDTIERAIARGAGTGDGAQIEEVTFEGVGPSGLGIIVECQTDNRNRTVSDLRGAFKRGEGNLGETGSVQWMFDRVSEVVAEKASVGDAEEEAIEAGANDVEKNDDGSYTFIGGITDFDAIRNALTERGWTIRGAERTYRAKNYVSLEGDAKQAAIELLEALDDLDDSQKVYSNLGQ